MIPKELLFRIYDDSLAIIVNPKTKQVVLLQNEVLKLWRKILLTNKIDTIDRNHPDFYRLTNLGLIEKPVNFISNNDLFPPTSHDSYTQDIRIINLWAFRNHIPISGHLELTRRCNLRCRHCYCVFNEKADTFSTEKIFAILDDLKENGTFGLVLTGGEIFCRKDILDILKYLAESKFIIRINSNGTLINERIVKAMEGITNIYRVHISLYSSDGIIHDRITGVPGSFQRTLKALYLLKEAGVDLRINCSIMKSNFASYQSIKYQIADKMGIPVHYDSVIYPKDDGSIENLNEQIDEEQNSDFLIFKKGVERQSGTETKPKLCKAGFSFFSICEDGKLYPCLKMKRYYRNPLGNLATDSFANIWQGSELIQKVRDSLYNKLRNCDMCNLSI